MKCANCGHKIEKWETGKIKIVKVWIHMEKDSSLFKRKPLGNKCFCGCTNPVPAKEAGEK